MLNDKNKLSVDSELDADPSGVAFAYGGVYPGHLYSKGKLHETHKVSFSVGKVGRYLLHVRLRKDALPVPGSPFALTVRPGPAHHLTTWLEPPTVPLQVCAHTPNLPSSPRLLRRHLF